MEDITTYAKVKQIGSKTKTMLTAFFIVEGLVQCEFLSKGSAFKKPSVSNHATYVRPVRGICTLKMCRSQWPQVSESSWSSKANQSFPICLINQNWPPVTFSLSVGYNNNEEGQNFKTMQR